MPLIVEELDIVNVEALFGKKLVLPLYQRPYSWSKESVNTLFNDTYNAFQSYINEYRLGSVILHREEQKNSKNKKYVYYNIVDGQQRLTTLSILLHCLKYKKNTLMDKKFSRLSNDAIVTNYLLLLRRVKDLPDNDREAYKKYLLEKCTIVQVVTDREQEAFQFFDSQNSRGKALAPHDLLKSYHLRAMNHEDYNTKIKTVNGWENLDTSQLHSLFEDYLYPLIKWHKRNHGLGYSSKTIALFKGIKKTLTHNHAIYHKSSHLYIEQLNSNITYEIFSSNELNQFQLTQPLLAGKRFFNYVQHYHNLLEQIDVIIKKYHKDGEIPNSGSGDSYTKQLYKCSLMFFADRFGFENLTPAIIEQLYSWSYSIRLTMHAVYQQVCTR